MSGRTTANGEFQFPGLRRGAYTFQARASGLAFLLRQVEIHGTDVRLDLELEEGVEIFGRVVRPNDAISGPLRVFARHVDSPAAPEPLTVPSATIDGEGKFTLQGLAAGWYALKVTNIETGDALPLLSGGEMVEAPAKDLELVIASGLPPCRTADDEAEGSP